MDSRNLSAAGSSPGQPRDRGMAHPGNATPGLFWSIFGRIWAVWTILIFVATMLLFYIPFLLFSYFRPDPQKTRRFYSLSRIWMGVFLPLAGTPLHVHGKEKFAKGQTYIVISNHNALVDVPVTSPFIPGANKTIAKIEMARVPLFGLMYRTGSVLVDRKDENSRRDSFAKMKEALDMGLHMCIYPEGTRNKTSEPLKSFHDGAFRLAMNTGRAIVPAIIFNSRRIMPPGVKFFFRPCRLYLHFLDPVTPGPGDTVESLKERIFGMMRDYYLAGPHATR